MRDDDRLDRIQELRELYNPPPETPREEMWSRIEAELPARRAGVGRGAPPPDAGEGAVSLPRERARRSRVGLWAGWVAAAAALVVLGVGIGRLSAPGPGVSGSSSGTEPEVAVESGAPGFRVAALEHLGRTETLLSLVRADARAGRVDRSVGEWGRSLLVETRLMLDSPVADDPALRDLLEDLELILAQVAVLSGTEADEEVRGRRELRLIAEGLTERDVLTRIQAVLPTDPDAVGSGRAGRTGGTSM